MPQLVLRGLCVFLAGLSAAISRPQRDIAIRPRPRQALILAADRFAETDLAEVRQKLVKRIPSRIVFAIDLARAAPLNIPAQGADLEPGAIDRGVPRCQFAINSMAVVPRLRTLLNKALFVITATAGRVAMTQAGWRRHNLPATVAAADDLRVLGGAL